MSTTELWHNKAPSIGRGVPADVGAMPVGLMSSGMCRRRHHNLTGHADMRLRSEGGNLEVRCMHISRRADPLSHPSAKRVLGLDLPRAAETVSKPVSASNSWRVCVGHVVRPSAARQWRHTLLAQLWALGIISSPRQSPAP